MSEFSRETLLNIIETDHVQCGEASALARMALAAMDSEPHTGDELSNLLWYSQEATCHSDPNYYCEFQRLATPGLIAGIIRELQERRKADREPVAEVVSIYGDHEAFGEREIRPLVGIQQMPYGTKLYRHAQQPVVPEEILANLEYEANHITAWHHIDEHSCKVNRRDLLTLVNACRAAMLPAAPVLSSMPDGVVTAEHRRVIEMLLSVCGAAFELADDSCQQDVDGEDCHVVPDDAFQKLSDALDEIENTLPTEDIDRPDVFLAWSAMPRAALKSLLQGGNSPVIPDGYVLVPIEPTEAMCDISHIGVDVYCGITDDNEYYSIGGAEAAKVWKAMLAAAPQEVK